MIVLDATAATAAVGIVAVTVAVWGGWLSLGSSRRGPGWALTVLTAWRPMPWLLAVAGSLTAILVEPAWVGIGVLYVAVVVGFLTRSVRRSLERVSDAYGLDDAPGAGAPMVGGRTGRLLVAGGVLMAVLGTWDVAVRGWAGIFGVLLAVCLVGVGAVILLGTRSGRLGR